MCLNSVLDEADPPSGMEDCILINNQPCLKCRSTWDLIRFRRIKPIWAKWLWSVKGPRRAITHAWRCFHGGLLTHDELSRRGCACVSRCELC